MKKYKIQYQKSIYGISEYVDYNKPDVYSQVIKCNEYKKIPKFRIEITEKNIEDFNKKYGDKYNIGDFFESSIEKIIFYKNDINIYEQNVYADPYFKLEIQKDDGSWETILKHQCSGYHKNIKNINTIERDPIN